jgi:hypothetical protein
VLEIELDAIRGSNGNSILKKHERGNDAVNIGGPEVCTVSDEKFCNWA